MNNAVKYYEMVGDSMSPFLQEGDSLLAREVKPKENLCLGDCLVYGSSDIKKICHRLVKRKANLLILKGDDLRQSDSPVSFADILGKVVAIKRQGQLIFVNTFWQKIRARISVYLSLFSLRFSFFIRLNRLLYYPPSEIARRLLRKFWRARLNV